VASSISSEKLGHEYVGLEHMLLALLKYEESKVPQFFAPFNASEEDIISEVREYLHLSKENHTSNRTQKSNPAPPKPIVKDLATPTLEKHALNLNMQAIKGKFDGIIGKQQEDNGSLRNSMQKNKKQSSFTWRAWRRKNGHS
jgi:ATP-dependent Clp protease ATP-binding subunit ClpA